MRRKAFLLFEALAVTCAIGQARAADGFCERDEDCTQLPDPICEVDDSITVYEYPGRCVQNSCTYESSRSYGPGLEPCQTYWDLMMRNDQGEIAQRHCELPFGSGGCVSHSYYVAIWPDYAGEPECEWVYPPEGTSCDDGNACTASSGERCCLAAEAGDGACQLGECVPGPYLTPGELCEGAIGHCVADAEEPTRLVCQDKCGDGLWNPENSMGEPCDDGNAVNGDGCSSTCQIESGWTCGLAGSGSSACKPICGDGYLRGIEQCDDKNHTDNDGCSSNCQIEDGWTCAVGADGSSVCTPICGDGKLRGNEPCDDGNEDFYDGCICTAQGAVVERGWACNASGCSPILGDGIIVGSEKCDDGNLSANDGCYKGQIERGWTCRTGLKLVLVLDDDLTPMPSVCRTVCGDTIPAGIEVCDDGSENGLPGKCNTSCNGIVGVCGDGKTNSVYEQCDLGDEAHPTVLADGTRVVNKADAYDFLQTRSCTLDCKIGRFCGNGVCDPEEQAGCWACPQDCAGKLSCDDGNPCTTNDVCKVDGTCGGVTKDCNNLTSSSSCYYPTTCSEQAQMSTTKYSRGTCQNGTCVPDLASATTVYSICATRDTDGQFCTVNGYTKRCSAGRCGSTTSGGSTGGTGGGSGGTWPPRDEP